MTPADPRDGLRAKCPRCDDSDPLATQVSVDSSRGFKFAVMTCRCGHGEVAAYYDDARSLQDLSDKFYRIAHARPEAVDYKTALQAAVDGIKVPKMTAARAEYYKAGARAAIAAMNAALTPDQSP